MAKDLCLDRNRVISEYSTVKKKSYKNHRCKVYIYIQINNFFTL